MISAWASQIIALTLAALAFTHLVTSGVSSQGTLIVQVPTRDGIVLCADRRTWNFVQGASDNEDKLFELSARSAFATSGIRAVHSPRDLSKLYDVAESVRKFFVATDALRIFDHWERLQKWLGESYVDYVRNGGLRFDSAHFLADGTVYTLRFLYLNADGDVRVSQIAFRQFRRAGAAEDTLEVGMTHDSGSELKSVRLLGQTEVATELKSGTDKRFDDLRRDPEIRRFYDLADPSRVSVNQGLHFAKLMIRVSHERHGLLPSGTRLLVGPTCNCLLMAPRKGVRWLGRNMRA